MSHTENLPRVEATYEIIAPHGGFSRQLREYDFGDEAFIELEIREETGLRLRHWLRISPHNKRDVVLHPTKPSTYIITREPAVFIAKRDGEAIPNKPMVTVWGEIDTTQLIEGEPAGLLTMWEYDSNQIRQIGA